MSRYSSQFSHPLSRSSRQRRRMLILSRNAADTVLLDDSEELSELIMEETSDLLQLEEFSSLDEITTYGENSDDNSQNNEQPVDKKPLQMPTCRMPAFVGLQKVLQGKRPLTWVFAGDVMSNTHPHFRASLSYTDRLSRFLREEATRPHDEIIDVGWEEETANSLVSELDEKVLRFLPDIVVVSVALSDCKANENLNNQFQDDLFQIIEKIRDAEAIPILQTPYRIDQTCNPSYGTLRSYIKMIRDVVRETEAPYVDHWEYWKPILERPQDLKMLLGKDGLHLNRKGHKAIFQNFMKCLQRECHFCTQLSISSSS